MVLGATDMSIMKGISLMPRRYTPLPEVLAEVEGGVYLRGHLLVSFHLVLQITFFPLTNRPKSVLDRVAFGPLIYHGSPGTMGPPKIPILPWVHGSRDRYHGSRPQIFK